MFASLANGQAQRVRAIEGQKTLLGRTMHGIAYDEIHDEIYVTQQFAQAILVFHGSADGEEVPVRVIRGSNTQLVAADNLAVDPVHGEIYVPEGEKILVFSRTANGNVAPIRIISGPNVGTVGGVVVDPRRNLIIATTRGPRDRQASATPRVTLDETGRPFPSSAQQRAASHAAPPSGRLSIFPRTGSGDLKPLRVISPVRTGRMAIDAGSGLLFMMQQQSHVGVWHIDDLLEGRVPPRFTVGRPGFFSRGMGLALDPTNQAVIVSDKDLNAVLTFRAPEVFSFSRRTSKQVRR